MPPIPPSPTPIIASASHSPGVTQTKAAGNAESGSISRLPYSVLWTGVSVVISLLMQILETP